MPRFVILGFCAVAYASLLGGCVIVIGNEDDFEDGYHADFEFDFHDDDRIEPGTLLSDLRARFNDDDDLRRQPILIAAKDGVVTLSGEVSSARALDRAVQLAAQTPGVDSVVLKVVVAVDRGAGR